MHEDDMQQYISDGDINEVVSYKCGDGLRKAILAIKNMIRIQYVSAYCFFFLVAITTMVNQVYQVYVWKIIQIFPQKRVWMIQNFKVFISEQCVYQII